MSTGSSDSESEDSVSGSTSSTSSIGETPIAAKDVDAILGENPELLQKYGQDLSDDLIARWNTYLTKGLSKESRQKLLAEWNTPKNCPLLNAPILNKEIESAIPPSDIKRDQYLKNLQSIMGKGLTALGQSISTVLADKDKYDQSLTTALVTSGQLLTDMFHTISTHRRHVLAQHLNPKVQKLIPDQPIDENLFGTDFFTRCMSAKAMAESAKEIMKASTSQSLNSARPNYKTRQKIVTKKAGRRRPTEHSNRRKYQNWSQTSRSREGAQYKKRKY